MNSSMFEGYDEDRKPPYSQDVYFETKGKIYKVTYYVCRGYGGSISITSSPSILITSEKENEKLQHRKHRQ